MPLGNFVPVTGSIIGDMLSAFVVFCVGAYVATQTSSKAGYVPCVLAIYWGYLIYTKM